MKCRNSLCRCRPYLGRVGNVQLKKLDITVCGKLRFLFRSTHRSRYIPALFCEMYGRQFSQTATRASDEDRFVHVQYRVTLTILDSYVQK